MAAHTDLSRGSWRQQLLYQAVFACWTCSQNLGRIRYLGSFPPQIALVTPRPPQPPSHVA